MKIAFEKSDRLYRILGKENPYRGKEDDFQIQVARYLNYLNLVWCHVANERNTDVKRGAKLKRMGVKRGMPDIMIFCKNIAIELKAGANRVSEAQHERMNRLQRVGWRCYVCYNFDSVVKALAKNKVNEEIVVI